MKFVAFVFFLARRLWSRIRMFLLKPLFGSYGSGLIFDPDGLYSYKNIHVGDNVNLGYRPVLMAELSEIKMGSHIMFGPNVVVIGGGHNITVIGQQMIKVHEKTGNEDLGVIIEDDVWVGARAIILRGVCVGRGSIIGAGTVVNKSIPPYSIVVGNPARIVGFRWDVETILTHEMILYPPEKRLSRNDISQWQIDKKMLKPKRLVHA